MQNDLEEASAPNPVSQESDATIDAQSIHQTLCEMVAGLHGVDVAEIESEQTFAECGLDAVQLSHLQTMVEKWVGCELLVTPADSAGSLVQQVLLDLKDTAIDNLQPANLQPTLSLASVAYTLQVGREAMAERLALVVSSIEELMEQLKQYDHKESDTGQVYQGNIKTSQQTANLLIEGATGEAFVKMVVDNREYAKLAQLWVLGVEIDWRLLYGEEKPRRISLPTYPFAKKRYWFNGHLNRNATTIQKRKDTKLSLPDKIDSGTIDNIAAETNLLMSNNGPDRRPKLLLQSLDEVSIPKTVGDAQEQTGRLMQDSIAFSKKPAINPAVDQSAKSSKRDVATIAKQLQQQLAALLFVDLEDISNYERFVDLGLDSITGVEWVRQINAEFGADIHAARLYDHPTVERLAKYLTEITPQNSPESMVPHAPARTQSAQIQLKHLTAIQRAEQPLHGTTKGASTSEKESIQQQTRDEHLQSIPIQVDKYSNRINDSSTESIAIIGMSGRFPGANDVDELWQNIATGVDSITEVSPERWDVERYYDPHKEAPGKSYSKWLGALDDIDKFDPLFFEISPREAELMDPQQRLFLEEAWKAFEDAGYAGCSLAEGRCGVFVGASAGDYHTRLNQSGSEPDAYMLMGSSPSILAARLSYILDLKGASLTIDTACSSSLVAIHEGCQSLLSGQNEMVLAGGVCVLTGPQMHIMTSKAQMLAADGRCKTFDNQADGFGIAEGVGVVVLKRLADAERDGDQIYGVIKGSAINQDGATNGITAPSADAQTALALEVYRQAAIDPETIQFVEAHGTGTKLGDPIEISALTDAYRKWTDKRNYCAIGSVKTNIGHTLTAAGVAGVMKVLLALKYKMLPPSLHFENANEHIDFENSPFYVNTQLRDWSIASGPRRAAVSSFGFSGTNAHLVVEEYQGAREQSGKVTGDESAQIIVLSARNEERLQAYAHKLLAYLSASAMLVPNDLEVASTPNLATQAIAETPDIQAIRQSLRELVADILGVDIAEIEDDQTFTDCGLDTIQLSRLQTMVEERVGCELPSTFLTTEASVASVAKEWASQGSVVPNSEYTPQASLALPSSASLVNIAYTLQVGRESMEERLAFVVSSIEELIEQLNQYEQKESVTGHFYQGNTKDSKETTSLLIDGEKGEAFIKAIINDEEYDKVAQLWVAGVEIDWRLLHGDETPRRISLPTYPFAKKRYWFDEHMAKNNQQQLATPASMAPLPTSVLSDPQNATAESVALKHGKQKVVLKVLDAHILPDENRTAQENSMRLSLESLTEEAGKTARKHPSLPAHAPVETPVQNTAQVQVMIEQQLRQQLVELLYVEPDDVETQKKFLDLGLDSITGVEWVKRINGEFGLNIPATTLYDYPTLQRLAQYLAEMIPHESSRVHVTKSGATRATLPQGTKAETRLPIVLNPLSAELAQQVGLVVSGVQAVDDTHLTTWVVPSPQANEIQIQVQASAINFPDIMCIKGLYPTMPSYPFVPGFEVSGIVTAVGRDVQQFAEGDEVIALTGQQLGGHAHYVNVSPFAAVKKPRNVTFEEACSLPVIFLTIHHALQVANLKEGEHILIQTAAGGCGLMAVQLANLRHAVLYGTSSRDEKLAFLQQIGVDYRLNYTTDFDESILAITEERGVDVVLNMLGGLAIQKGLNVLAPGGRYVELAVQGLKASPTLDLSGLVHNQTFYSIDGRRGGFGDPERLSEYLHEMVQLVEHEEIYPIVHRIYPIAQIQEALRYVESGAHIGKVVISHTQAEAVDLTQKCRSDLIQQKARSRQKPAPVHPGAQTIQNTPVISSMRHEEIAIVGMSGRFPGANNVEEFWQNIAGGVDSITEVSPARWDVNCYYDPNRQAPGKSYSKWLGALEDIDKFDPLFFEISPREAELMDPQQRLFLEEAWKALEDAGYAGHTLSERRCGVFVGAGTGDYHASLNQNKPELDAYTLMGSSPSILAARLAYILNLKGASLAIDTACSSSLVAIHEGCQSLLTGQNEMVLAGGVCVLTGPHMHIMTSKAQMLAADGRCKTFANQADGFGIAEGVGIVVLKRLADAERDGDHIYGVIKGSGINQNGATNGITAPSAHSQTALELEVYEQAGIDPATIQLIEAHGTGTKLGDPIEVQALTDAFRTYTDRTGYCAIGSVKTNIGHTLTTAGVAGVLKALLSLQHKQLPPSLHCEEPNEHIDFDNSPFYVNTMLRDWSTESGPRRAAVSSFGFSGTNAHLVLEEYEPLAVKPLTLMRQEAGTLWVRPRPEGSRGNNVSAHLAMKSGPQVIVLSAKNEERLREYAHKLLVYFAGFATSNPTPQALDETPDIQTIRQSLREIVANVLGVEVAEVAHDQTFDECGLDAVQLSRLQTTVEEQYSFELAITPSDSVESLVQQLFSLWGDGTSSRQLVVNSKHLAVGSSQPPALADIAYTLQVGREAMEERLALVVSSTEELAELLKQYQQRKEVPDQVFQGNIKNAKQTINLLVDSASGETYIKTVFKNQEYATLAQLWVLGVEIDWHLLYEGEPRRHISLPTYPFEKKRYWFPESSSTDQPPRAAHETWQSRQQNVVTKTAQILNFEAAWIEQALPVHDVDWVERISAEGDKRILVMYEDPTDYAAMDKLLGGVDVALQESGQARSLIVQFVGINSGLSAVEGNTSFMLDKTSQEDIAQWIKDVKHNGQLPDVILFLGHPPETDMLADGYPLSSAYKDEIRFLFHLIQGFMQHAWDNSIRGYYLFASTEAIPRLALEALSGLARATVLENPQQIYKTICVDPTLTADQRAVVLLQEWLLERSAATNTNHLAMVRYQGLRRFVSSLQERASTSPEATQVFRPGGTYLITGGLGAIGQHLCAYLSQHYQSTLIILARSKRTEETEGQIQTIEQYGGKVWYYPVDITDRQSLQETVARAKTKVDQIDGIIHLARTVEDDLIVNKHFDSFARVMAPKVEGTLYLDQATQDEPLDFFMIFSSAASYGIKGSPDYAYATAFQNAFAEWRQGLVHKGERSGQSLALCWGQWAMDPYSNEQRNALLKQMGFDFLTIESGMQILKQSLAQDNAIIGAIAVSEPQKVRRFLGIRPASREQNASDLTIEQLLMDLQDKTKNPEDLFRQIAKFDTRQLSDRQIKTLHAHLTRHSVSRAKPEIDGLNVEEVLEYEPTTAFLPDIQPADIQPADMQTVILAMLKKTLKLEEDRFDPQMTFLEYGMDSITGMQMATNLEQSLGIEVPPRWLIEYPTLEQFAGKLQTIKRQGTKQQADIELKGKENEKRRA